MDISGIPTLGSRGKRIRSRLPGQRSGKGLIGGEWAEGSRLMGLMGWGEQGKGKSFGI